jgi:hypothetical protein
MLMRFFANCLCVFSVLILLWGISPVFVDDVCATWGCQSGDSTCSKEQNEEGYCTTFGECRSFFNYLLMLRRAQIQSCPSFSIRPKPNRFQPFLGHFYTKSPILMCIFAQFLPRYVT